LEGVFGYGQYGTEKKCVLLSRALKIGSENEVDAAGYQRTFGSVARYGYCMWLESGCWGLGCEFPKIVRTV